MGVKSFSRNFKGYKNIYFGGGVFYAGRGGDNKTNIEAAQT